METKKENKMKLRNKSTWTAGLLLSLLLTSAYASDVLFDIKEFKVDAAHESSAVQDVLRGYAGSQKSYHDVMRALEAVKTYYAKAGESISVSLPPEQDITAGTIQLRITSAEDRKRLRNVRDNSSVRDAFPSLKEGIPVDTMKVSMSADLFNENPYRAAYVEYATSDEGTDVSLGIEKKRDPLAFVVSLDNTGTRSTGKERVTLSAQKMDMPGGATASATYIASVQKPDSVNIVVLGYKVPLYSQYSSLDFYAANSKADTGTVSDFFNVSGKGHVYGARLTRYLATETEGLAQQVLVGFERRDYLNSVTIPGSSSSLVPDYTVKPLTVGYNIRRKGSWGFAVSLTHGMDGSDLDAARTGAVAGYNIFKASGEYSLPIGADWSGFIAGSLQHTTDLLVPGEQFGVGGIASVRGLNERELSGDKGARLSFEIRKPVTDNVVAALFLDSGRAWRNSPLPGEVASAGATSAGAGIRYFWQTNLSATVDFAHVLRGDGETRAGADRVLASLTYAF